MAGGTFSILRSVRGYHIYKEICSQSKFRANKFSRLKFRKFEPFAKIAKISPREFFPPYSILREKRWPISNAENGKLGWNSCVEASPNIITSTSDISIYLSILYI